MTRLLYAAAVTITLGMSTLTFAQGTGTGGGGTGTGGGFGGGTGTSGGFGGGTGTGGGTTFSGGAGGTTGGFTGNSGGGTVPGRTGAGGRAVGGSTAVSISPTNFLAATYGNPLYNGRPGSSNISLTAGGGFGQPSFGAVTTTTQNGTTTTRGGANANALGGRATVNSGQGMIGLGGPPITYALDVKFPIPAISSPQVQANLQGIISRTSQLKQPAQVTVLVEGDTAILRGRVADEDEKRLVEGMIRLEPGIKDVRNELTFP